MIIRAVDLEHGLDQVGHNANRLHMGAFPLLTVVFHCQPNTSMSWEVHRIVLGFQRYWGISIVLFAA